MTLELGTIRDIRRSASQIVTNKSTSNTLQVRCPSYRPTNSVRAMKGKQSIRRRYSIECTTTYRTPSNIYPPYDTIQPEAQAQSLILQKITHNLYINRPHLSSTLSSEVNSNTVRLSRSCSFYLTTVELLN